MAIEAPPPAVTTGAAPDGPVADLVDTPHAYRRPGADLGLTFAVLGLVTMGFNRTRVGGWPLSDLMFMVAYGFMVVDILTGRDGLLLPKRARRASPPVLVGIILLLTAGALSALRSWNPGESLLVELRFAWIFLGFFWVLRAASRDRHKFGMLLTGWRGLLLLNCAIAITGQLGITNFSMENTENRQTGFFDQPNELAGLIAIGLPLFVLGVPRRREYRTDGRELLSRAWPIGLCFYAIATTGSMSALLAGFAGLVTILVAGGWRHIRRPGRAWTSPLLPMVVLFAGVVGFMALASSDLPVVERFDRYASGDSGVNASVDTRDQRNDAVIQRFDETLVLGQGFGSFNPYEPGAREAAGAHNMFFRFVFQAGLPGLIGVLMIVGFTLMQCVRLLRNTRGTGLHATTIALTASLVTANTFAMFQPTEYHRYYWVSVAMVGALWALRKEEVRVAAERLDAEVAGIARLPTRRR